MSTCSSLHSVHRHDSYTPYMTAVRQYDCCTPTWQPYTQHDSCTPYVIAVHPTWQLCMQTRLHIDGALVTTRCVSVLITHTSHEWCHSHTRRQACVCTHDDVQRTDSRWKAACLFKAGTNSHDSSTSWLPDQACHGVERLREDNETAFPQYNHFPVVTSDMSETCLTLPSSVHQLVTWTQVVGHVRDHPFSITSETEPGQWRINRSFPERYRPGSLRCWHRSPDRLHALECVTLEIVPCRVCFQSDDDQVVDKCV